MISGELLVPCGLNKLHCQQNLISITQFSEVSFKGRLVDEKRLKILSVALHKLYHAGPELEVAVGSAVQLVGERTEHAVAVTGDLAERQAQGQELRGQRGHVVVVVILVFSVLFLTSEER
jgi:hypothetical protein